MYELSDNQIISYMLHAFITCDQSKDQKRKVGAILVDISDHMPRIIAEGCNGTYPGESNESQKNTETLQTVRHAERNIINKLVRNPSVSTIGTVLFVTYEPCPDCLQLLIDAGVQHIYYAFKDTKGGNVNVPIGYTQVDMFKVRPAYIDICRVISKEGKQYDY